VIHARGWSLGEFRFHLRLEALTLSYRPIACSEHDSPDSASKYSLAITTTPQGGGLVEYPGEMAGRMQETGHAGCVDVHVYLLSTISHACSARIKGGRSQKLVFCFLCFVFGWTLPVRTIPTTSRKLHEKTKNVL